MRQRRPPGFSRRSALFCAMRGRGLESQGYTHTVGSAASPGAWGHMGVFPLRAEFSPARAGHTHTVSSAAKPGAEGHMGVTAAGRVFPSRFRAYAYRQQCRKAGCGGAHGGYRCGQSFPQPEPGAEEITYCKIPVKYNGFPIFPRVFPNNREEKNKNRKKRVFMRVIRPPKQWTLEKQRGNIRIVIKVFHNLVKPAVENSGKTWKTFLHKLEEFA